MCIIFLRLADALLLAPLRCTRPRGTRYPLFLAKGFGASPSSSSSSSKKTAKKSTAKKVQKQVLQHYGGDIARGTQGRIDRAMAELPPHLRLATGLYQKLQKWNQYVSQLGVLEQTKLSSQEVEGAKRGQQQLDQIMAEHDLTERDLHNVFQQITWDASADAKAARAVTGRMPAEIEARIDRACEILASSAANRPRCLDVGCGFGVLIPHLTNAGISPSSIVGVDLSPEMIRHARTNHRQCTFVAADFVDEYKDEEGFDGIVFCSALHDLPDMIGALQKAESLLNEEGRIVIVHPQGASHVQGQVQANPILVKRGLPTAEELSTMLPSLTLEHSPARAGTPEETKNGYLAVLRKCKEQTI